MTAQQAAWKLRGLSPATLGLDGIRTGGPVKIPTHMEIHSLHKTLSTNDRVGPAANSKRKTRAFALPIHRQAAAENDEPRKRIDPNGRSPPEAFKARRIAFWTRFP